MFLLTDMQKACQKFGPLLVPPNLGGEYIRGGEMGQRVTR